MKVTIDFLPEFERRAKDLAKKYRSFENDYNEFLDELEKNPFAGEPLGHHTFKNRMAITSKMRGKSGGARVITYNLQVDSSGDDVRITLMTVYDKQEISNISDAYLRYLVDEVRKRTAAKGRR